MKLIKHAQNSFYSSAFSATNNVLTVTVDGVSDDFDFNVADGVYHDFQSDVLAIVPIMNATVDGGEVTVNVNAFYPDEPMSADYDSVEEYQLALTTWQNKTQNSEENL